MNQAEYLKAFKETIELMYKITEAKNKDYSWEESVDAFANFRVVEKFWIATVEQWFITRMSDKFIRIINLIKQWKNFVEWEKVDDTLLDLANYAILFRLYLKSKNESD